MTYQQAKKIFWKTGRPIRRTTWKTDKWFVVDKEDNFREMLDGQLSPIINQPITRKERVMTDWEVKP